MKKKLIKITVMILIIVMFFIILRVMNYQEVEEIESYDLTSYQLSSIVEQKYIDYLDEKEVLISNDSYINVIEPTEFILDDDQYLNQASESFGYDDYTYTLIKDEPIDIPVSVDESGLYEIWFDYYYVGHELIPPKYSIQIDGQYQFHESRQTTLPIIWENLGSFTYGANQKEYIYETDRYNNEIRSNANVYQSWQNQPLYDSSFMILEPLLFELEAGDHHINFFSRTDDVTIGNVYIKSKENIDTYETFMEKNSNALKYDSIITLQAENYQFKSDPSIKAYSDTDLKVSPYDSKNKLINAIDAYTWDESGKSITWEIQVNHSGLYQLSFKYMQYRLIDLPVYRQIKINGQVPYEQLNAYPFQYSTQWKNETLHDEDETLWVYLEEGQNDITLTSSVEVYSPIIRSIENSMNKITNLAIQIRQLTGGVTDVNRDWDLIDYIPTISDDLYTISEELKNAYAYGNGLNEETEAASGLVSLKYAIENLNKLADEPNQIPNNLSMLSEGTESVNQYLGDLMVSITKQSLALDQFYLHGQDTELPRAQANIFAKIWNGIIQLVQSFIPSKSIYEDNQETIDVWVNRSRAHIDLLQQMIDQEFTPETGIHVNLSLMPNENKLIASLAAGKEPDMVIGVSQNKPYEFAVRGAAVDLRTFDGYEDLIQHIPSGTMLPYIIDEGVYGIPDSLDFYLMYYRNDILEQLNITLPQTWEEMYSILPKLQRYGMNFYVPLGSKVSYKSFIVTSPFFYQNDASLYDGMFSGIGSDEGYLAMKQMTELFTLYNLPKQVSSFYNQFRYGLMPIGIANSAAYIQLLIAAPEIKGNWDVANVLGNLTDEGINNEFSVTSTASMIFNTSQHQENAFELLQWWLDTDTQINYANDLQTTFGKEYIWFSSNYEALKQLPLSSDHVDTILSQIAVATSVPNIPGSYYLEREISDAWSKVMYNGESLRNAVDTAILNANREIERKMTEFGYMSEGVVVEEYRIPTLDTVDEWLTYKDEEND